LFLVETVVDIVTQQIQEVQEQQGQQKNLHSTFHSEQEPQQEAAAAAEVRPFMKADSVVALQKYLALSTLAVEDM
jgi:hypothetical protein